MENPWNIHSIYEFQYFNCPTCIFRNQSKQEFVNHAYEFHPDSLDYLINITDESLDDITCPWDIKNIKLEEPIIELKIKNQLKSEEHTDENFDNTGNN